MDSILYLYLLDINKLDSGIMKRRTNTSIIKSEGPPTNKSNLEKRNNFNQIHKRNTAQTGFNFTYIVAIRVHWYSIARIVGSFLAKQQENWM